MRSGGRARAGGCLPPAGCCRAGRRATPRSAVAGRSQRARPLTLTQLRLASAQSFPATKAQGVRTSCRRPSSTTRWPKVSGGSKVGFEGAIKASVQIPPRSRSTSFSRACESAKRRARDYLSRIRSKSTSSHARQHVNGLANVAETLRAPRRRAHPSGGRLGPRPLRHLLRALERRRRWRRLPAALPLRGLRPLLHRRLLPPRTPCLPRRPATTGGEAAVDDRG